VKLLGSVSEWKSQLFATTLAGMVFASKEGIRRQLVARGLTPFGVGTVAVGSRFAVETVGLGTSYALGGKQGVKDWQIASSRMYDWGIVGSIPIAGSLIELVPNPLGVAGVLFDSGKMIGEHTKIVAEGGAMVLTSWLRKTALQTPFIVDL
jgi:hypothetical protein